MASQKEANLAREQYSDSLRDMGAHAIAVDEVKHDNSSTFAVIASFEAHPGETPDTLDVKSGRKRVKVPLVVRVAEKFKPE